MPIPSAATRFFAPAGGRVAACAFAKKTPKT
jgi:hypothetical protein